MKKRFLYSLVCGVALCSTSAFATFTNPTWSNENGNQGGNDLEKAVYYTKQKLSAISPTTFSGPVATVNVNNYVNAYNALQKAKAVHEAYDYLKANHSDVIKGNTNITGAAYFDNLFAEGGSLQDAAYEVSKIANKYGLALGDLATAMAKSTATVDNILADNDYKIDGSTGKQKAFDDEKANLASSVKLLDSTNLKTFNDTKAAWEKEIADKKAYNDIILGYQAVLALKTGIGAENDAVGGTSIYAKINKLNAPVGTNGSILYLENDLKTKTKASVGDSGGSAPADLETAVTLYVMKAYYADSGKGNNGTKVGELEKLIGKLEKGEKVDLNSADYDNIRSEINNTKVTGWTAYASAVEALSNAKEKKEKLEKELIKRKAQLESMQSSLNTLKAATPEGQKAKKEISKNVEQITKTFKNKQAIDESVLNELASALINDSNFTAITNMDGLANDKKQAIQKAANNLATAIVDANKDAISTQGLGALHVQLNNMNKRLGELRGLNGEAGAWARVWGGKMKSDDTKFNYYSTQIGADKKTSYKEGDLYLGVLFGYDQVKTDNKSNSYSGGVYASFIANNGFFFDTTFKFIQTSYDAKAGVSIDRQTNVLTSFEGGYRFSFDDAFYAEPSLELITGRVGEYSQTSGDTKISVDAHSPIIFKPQVFVGGNIGDFRYRAGVGGVLTNQENTASISLEKVAGVEGLNAQGNTKLGKNNHGFASIGTNYTLGNARINLGVERSFGGDITNEYEVNMTVRYGF